MTNETFAALWLVISCFALLVRMITGDKSIWQWFHFSIIMATLFALHK